MLTTAQNAPRPEGKSVGACQIMVHRLKGTLKDDLAVLRHEDTAGEAPGTPKKPATPRKRKTKGDNHDTSASPTKRGRKQKAEVQAEVDAQGEDDELLTAKAEPHDEEPKIEAED